MTCQIVTGTFKNVASTPFFQALPFVPNFFSVRNLTRSGVTALGVSGSLTSDRIIEAYYNPAYMTSGTALIKQQGTVAGILAPINNGICAINGFTLINPATQANGPNIVINSFTPGTTTVFVTNTAHGFQVGDVVRIGNMTSAKQLGGITMTVTAVGSTTQFTTLLDSSNALTSVGTVYKVRSGSVSSRSLYYPQERAIAAITLANPMVVTTLVQQNYQVGDVVRFQIPTVFGMQQINSSTNGLPLEFTVVAINNAVGTQTVSLNVDSSAFTAFAWPAVASYPYGLPEMIPQGEGNLNNLSAFGVSPSPLPYANQDILGFATQNLASAGVLIGAGDGTNSATTGGIIGSTVDAWEWTATLVNQTF
jgi:hypothetical protein